MRPTILTVLFPFLFSGCVWLAPPPYLEAQASNDGNKQILPGPQEVSNFVLMGDDGVDYRMVRFDWYVLTLDLAENGWNSCAALGNADRYAFADWDGNAYEGDWEFLDTKGDSCDQVPDAILGAVIFRTEEASFTGPQPAAYGLTMDLTDVPADDGNTVRADLKAAYAWDAYAASGTPLVGDTYTIVSETGATE